MIYKTVIYAWGLKRGFPKIGVSLLGVLKTRICICMGSILGSPYVKKAIKGSCKSLVKWCCRA